MNLPRSFQFVVREVIRYHTIADRHFHLIRRFVISSSDARKHATKRAIVCHQRARAIMKREEESAILAV